MTINRALGRSHAQGRLQEKASKESQRQAEELALQFSKVLNSTLV
jgi:hypothetical protein